jgi:adenylosuccinate lyase
MALAPKLGRGLAHELVRRLHRESQRQGVPFQEAVRRSPDVRAHASARRIEQALDYRNSLGLCGAFVDRVLRDWRRGRAAARRRRPARR